jgi:alpha-1,2-mannosyltransferase
VVSIVPAGEGGVRRAGGLGRALLEEPRLWWALAILCALVEVLAALSAHHIDTPQIWGGLNRFLHGYSPYGVVTHLPYGYDHPPGSTLIDAPLGLLSLPLAEKVIVVLSGITCMLAIALVSIGRKNLLPWRIALAAFIVSVSRPFHEELTLGNIDLLALAPMAVGMIAIERGRERLGGVLMALGVCIKPTAALVLLAPLLARRWRACAIALSTVLVVTLIGFAVVPHSWRFFTSVVPFLTGPEQGHADYNGSFTGVVEYAGLGSSTPATVTQLIALLVLVGVTVRYRRALADRLPMSVALLVVAMLVVPRYSFEVYGLYLVLALPVILRARGRLEITLAAIAVWFLTVRDVLPLEGSVVDRFRELRPGLGHIALGVLLVVMLERTRRSEARGEATAGHEERTDRVAQALDGSARGAIRGAI